MNEPQQRAAYAKQYSLETLIYELIEILYVNVTKENYNHFMNTSIGNSITSNEMFILKQICIDIYRKNKDYHNKYNEDLGELPCRKKLFENIVKIKNPQISDVLHIYKITFLKHSTFFNLIDETLLDEFFNAYNISSFHYCDLNGNLENDIKIFRNIWTLSDRYEEYKETINDQRYWSEKKWNRFYDFIDGRNYKDSCIIDQFDIIEEFDD